MRKGIFLSWSFYFFFFCNWFIDLNVNFQWTSGANMQETALGSESKVTNLSSGLHMGTHVRFSRTPRYHVADQPRPRVQAVVYAHRKRFRTCNILMWHFNLCHCPRSAIPRPVSSKPCGLPSSPYASLFLETWKWQATAKKKNKKKKHKNWGSCIQLSIGEVKLISRRPRHGEKNTAFCMWCRKHSMTTTLPSPMGEGPYII